MILTSKNMRNELLLNYHKFKKIPEIMTTNLKFEISEIWEGGDEITPGVIICPIIRHTGKSIKNHPLIILNSNEKYLITRKKSEKSFFVENFLNIK